MVFRKWMAAALVAVAGMGGGVAHAQEVSVSAKDLKALLERVEAAEARIQELESRTAPALPQSINGTPRSVQALTPAGAQFREASAVENDPVLQRLENLENKWVDLYSTVSSAITEKSSGSSMQIEGRIHLDYWGFPDTDAGTNVFEGSGTPFVPQNPQDRCTTRRMRLGFKGDVKDNMLYVAQLEFAGVDDPVFCGHDEPFALAHADHEVAPAEEPPVPRVEVGVHLPDRA